MSADLLKLVPLIQSVAPVLASKLLGPGVGAAVAILAKQFDTAPDANTIAAKMEATPTSEATAKLQIAELQAGGGAPDAVPTDGLIVDARAVQIKTLVSGLLFAAALKLFGDASLAGTIADAAAPAIMGGLSTLGGLALNWLIGRTIAQTNEATIKAVA